MRFADPEAQAEIDRLTACLQAVERLAEAWASDDGRAWLSNCGADLQEALLYGKVNTP